MKINSEALVEYKTAVLLRREFNTNNNPNTLILFTLQPCGWIK